MVQPIPGIFKKDSFMGMVISKEGNSISTGHLKMELHMDLENT